MNKLKTLILLSFLLFIYIFVSAQNYVTAISGNISEAVFRLHVIANSDTSEDQSLKLKVRDSLIKYMNTICSNCNTKQEAISIAKKHQSEFQKIAEQTIQNNGYNYSVKINIDNFYFPTKNYGDISLPAGLYDALKVEIGSAKGQNWWCVMFPPLCFVNVSSGIVPEESKENLKVNLSDEEFSIISNENSPQIKFKFKLIEFLNSTNILTAKK